MGVNLGRSAANKTLVHEMAGMLALGCAAHAAYLQPSYYGTSFSTASVKSLVTRLCSSNPIAFGKLSCRQRQGLELVLDRPCSTKSAYLLRELNRLYLRVSERGLFLKHSVKVRCVVGKQ